MASLQLLFLALAVQLVAPSVDLEAETPGGPVEGVQKGSLSHPVLVRRKREWIWNSLYVEEEKPAPIPYKIGQVSFLALCAFSVVSEVPESHTDNGGESRLQWRPFLFYGP